MSKNIALTGATGFIGSQLARYLHDQGYQLRLLVRPGKQAPLNGEHITVISGTLSNKTALKQLVESADTVVHCAATVRGGNWQHFHQPNVVGTQNLLNATVGESPQQFLLISSLAAREPQLSWYAHSKHLAEQACLNSNHINCTVLRPPAVYGPGDKEMLPLLRMLYRGLALRITPNNQRLSLIHVNDLITAIHTLISHHPTGTFAVNDGEPDDYDWNKLCHIVGQYAGKRVLTLPLPAFALKLLARSNLLLAKWRNNKPMLSPGKANELLWPDWTTDSQPLIEATDWSPTTRLLEGLQDLPL